MRWTIVNVFTIVYCKSKTGPIITILSPDGNLPCLDYRPGTPIRELNTVTRSWTSLLSDIRAKIELCLDFSFNSVLVNWYRNGEDYVGWHADNERELGEQPFIVSLTFGSERLFEFRHKKSLESGSMLLRNGTLLIMRPNFQRHWLHSVPIEKNLMVGRINLTFRKVIPKINGFSN
jgi:alkylated DNA repair dioxygenase AlkB